MSKLRSLNTAFWSDPWIENLDPEEKLLFIYFITNEKTNMLGIYESSVKKISFETGVKKENVETALMEFEKAGKVKYVHNHIILINFMKHQNYNTNMKKSAIDIYNSLPKELKMKELNISKDNPSKGFETLMNLFGMVPKVEVEVEVESEVESNFNLNLPKKESGGTGSIDNKSFVESSKTSSQWIETLAMQLHVSIEIIKIFLDQFESHLIVTEEQKSNEREFKQHFSYWIKKQDLSQFSKKPIGRTNQLQTTGSKTPYYGR